MLPSDVPAACRTANANGAPGQRVNVASLERSSDVAMGTMSRLSLEWSDMLTGACRAYRSSRATCSRDHVALLRSYGRAYRSNGATWSREHVAPIARAERHARAIMSHLSLERSDMHAQRGRSIPSSLATCGAEHADGVHRTERHERAGIRGSTTYFANRATTPRSVVQCSGWSAPPPPDRRPALARRPQRRWKFVLKAVWPGRPGAASAEISSSRPRTRSARAGSFGP